MSEEGYRVPDVCRIVGISYRQLDYWARTELVTPSVRDAHGSGTQRLYSFQDLVSLKVIKKLLDTGVSLQRVLAVLVGAGQIQERGLGRSRGAIAVHADVVVGAAGRTGGFPARLT